MTKLELQMKLIEKVLAWHEESLQDLLTVVEGFSSPGGCDKMIDLAYEFNEKENN